VKKVERETTLRVQPLFFKNKMLPHINRQLKAAIKRQQLFPPTLGTRFLSPAKFESLKVLEIVSQSVLAEISVNSSFPEYLMYLMQKMTV
jgi:hypothetical protein